MKSDEFVTVHRITIARSTGSARPAINTARCRLCGLILERKDGPLSIGHPGLYAIKGGGTPNVVGRAVDELQDGMVMCAADKSPVRFTSARKSSYHHSAEVMGAREPSLSLHFVHSED